MPYAKLDSVWWFKFCDIREDLALSLTSSHSSTATTSSLHQTFYIPPTTMPIVDGIISKVTTEKDNTYTFSFTISGTTYSFTTGKIPSSVPTVDTADASVDYDKVDDLTGTMSYKGSVESKKFKLKMTDDTTSISTENSTAAVKEVSFNGSGSWVSS